MSKALLALSELSSLEAAWAASAELFSDYGFDRVFYGYTDLSTARSLGSPSDALIMTNMPPEYTKHYIHDGHYHHGPLTVWAGDNTGVCSWSRIPEIVASYDDPEAMLATIAGTQKFGITAGYSISFPPTGLRSKAAMALCAKAGLTQDDVEQIWKQSGVEIQIICNILNMKVLSLPHDFGRKADLTARQMEVLELKADGKSVMDISVLLEISPSTIEKHISAAKVALNVETLAQAINVLAHRNQLFQLGSGPADWQAGS